MATKRAKDLEYGDRFAFFDDDGDIDPENGPFIVTSRENAFFGAGQFVGASYVNEDGGIDRKSGHARMAFWSWEKVDVVDGD